MAIIKYILDGLVAHNDFTKKSFTLDANVTSILGIISAALNLYLIWK
jgi:hypothetical protein